MNIFNIFPYIMEEWFFKPLESIQKFDEVEIYFIGLVGFSFLFISLIIILGILGKILFIYGIDMHRRYKGRAYYYHKTTNHKKL